MICTVKGRFARVHDLTSLKMMLALSLQKGLTIVEKNSTWLEDLRAFNKSNTVN